MSFSNFTEETATGTGATLALAGVTTGNIPFSESFADGDPVAYVVEDSGGTIKVAGVGVYVSATDDITRADTWNWNGTVIDDTPSTNITLSGGTHTVRCDVINKEFNAGGVISGRVYTSPYYHETSATNTMTADRVYYAPLVVSYQAFYDSFAFEVTSSGTNARVGLYTSKDGFPDVLIAVHNTSFSVGSTGLKQATFDGGSMFLGKGNYYIGITADVNVALRSSQSDSNSLSQLGTDNMGQRAGWFYVGKTYAVLSDPAAISAPTFAGSANAMILGVYAT